jgi:glyoxylase-like metal-dependent hydrolase (beta-lactamase superfamily II)/rhodanese-related sulfurtransferase
VLFRQVLHPDLGCASYVIADTAAGLGAVVDPKRDVGEYLELAAANGFTIAHVIETHNHADHVSGRGRLAEATGARSWVSPLAGAGYRHDPFADGAEIELGQVRLRALHVPGHRPEHTAVVVVDGSRSSLPCAVLTGDSLFVNDVARPDLAVEKREGAAQLYHAIGRLLELDDGVEVFPGHTGGSLCGSARMSETTSSTIGFERASNPMLRLGEEFARFAPERLAAAIAAGSLAIDGRPAGQYDAAHIPGTIGIDATVNGFGTKAAWIAEPGAELVLVAADEPAALHMQGLLESVGLSAAGMLAGGFAAWTAAGLDVERFQVMDVDALYAAGDRVQILDVRDQHEWDELRITGSQHVVYHDTGRVTPPLDRDRPVAVICSTGRRSAMAVGLVRRSGFAEVIHVSGGGVGTWAARGYPIEQSQPAAV